MKEKLFWALLVTFGSSAFYLIIAIKQGLIKNDVDQFKTITAIFFGFIIVVLWRISKKYSDRWDTGTLLLAMSQLSWIVGLFLELYYTDSKSFIHASISTINSTCFLAMVPYLDLEEKQENLKPYFLNYLLSGLNFIKRHKYFYLLGCTALMLIFLTLIYAVHSNEIIEPEKIDLFLSMPTIVVIAVSLCLVFVIREKPEFIWLILVVVTLTLIAQFLVAGFIPKAMEQYEKLINFTYRLSLSVLYILLIWTYITDHQYRKYNKRLSDKNEELVEINEILEKAISEKEKLTVELAARNIELVQASAELAARNTELEQASAELAVRNTELEQAYAELAARNIELEQAMDKLKYTNSQLDDKVKENISLKTDMNHSIRGSLGNLRTDLEGLAIEKNISVQEILSRINATYELHDQLHSSKYPKLTLYDFLVRLCQTIHATGRYDDTFNSYKIKIDEKTYTDITKSRDLGSIINELAINAYKAKNHNNGKQILKVTVEQTDSHLILQVQDLGVGIEKNIKSINDIPNKGWGLQNVHRLIYNKYKGQEQIFHLEQGTLFEIKLPLHKFKLKKL